MASRRPLGTPCVPPRLPLEGPDQEAVNQGKLSIRGQSLGLLTLCAKPDAAPGTPSWGARRFLESVLPVASLPQV